MVRFLSGVLVALLFLPWPARAGELDEIASPHGDPSSCPACHTDVSASGEAAGGRYSLRGDSIDETCCICHITKCKPIEGKWNHPSNINRWDREEMTVPATLPLYDGYITCLTCHYRDKPEGADYKRIRILKIKGDQADWAGLCRDCHPRH